MWMRDRECLCVRKRVVSVRVYGCESVDEE